MQEVEEGGEDGEGEGGGGAEHRGLTARVWLVISYRLVISCVLVPLLVMELLRGVVTYPPKRYVLAN